MQKRKKDSINALTEFIQNNNLTYSQIGGEITKALKALGIKNSKWLEYDAWEAEIRVSKLAHGNRPSSEELYALSYWKFGKADEWRNLYFPDEAATSQFVKKTLTNEIDKVLDSSQKINFENFTKSNIRNGINNCKISPFKLAYIILGLLNFQKNDEFFLGKITRKVSLQKYANNWIESNLKSSTPLMKELTIQLRQTLDLKHAKRKELKQVTLRAIISVL